MRSALLAVLVLDYEEAERLLLAAVELDSTHVEAYVALARVFRARGEVGRAIRMHQNLLLRADLSGEEMVDALIDLAEALSTGGFTQRAIAAFEEALGHDPGRVKALRALVTLYQQEGDYERALATSRRLSHVDASGALAHESELRIQLAEVALADGQLDPARRALKKALKRDRGSVAAWLVMGRVEAERNKPKAALAAWSRIPAIDRAAGAEVYPRLAATYAALDRPRDFEAFLRGLIEEQPGDPHARLALAAALAARGEVEEGVAVLRELMALHPDELEGRAALCRLLLAAGRDREANTELAGMLGALERRGVLREVEKLA